jgi:hypothetical protein
MPAVILDKPSVFEPKGKPRGLSFNLFLTTDEEGNGFSSRGYRIMSGMIYPPSARVGTSIVPLLHLPENVSRWVYRALEDKGWAQEFGVELLPEDIAITPLMMSRLDAVYSYPSHWQEMKTV